MLPRQFVQCPPRPVCRYKSGSKKQVSDIPLQSQAVNNVKIGKRQIFTLAASFDTPKAERKVQNFVSFKKADDNDMQNI